MKNKIKNKCCNFFNSRKESDQNSLRKKKEKSFSFSFQNIALMLSFYLFIIFAVECASAGKAI